METLFPQHLQLPAIVIEKVRNVLINEKSVSVVRCLGEEYFIGVQFSEAIHKETHNLYRACRLRGIAPCTLQRDEVTNLVETGILPRGTRSATLLPVAATMEWFKAEANGARARSRSRIRARIRVKTVRFVDESTNSDHSDTEELVPACLILASLRHEKFVFHFEGLDQAPSDLAQ
jgi:hypothetical protein